jgi:hypothetical protein
VKPTIYRCWHFFHPSLLKCKEIQDIKKIQSLSCVWDKQRKWRTLVIQKIQNKSKELVPSTLSTSGLIFPTGINLFESKYSKSILFVFFIAMFHLIFLLKAHPVQQATDVMSSGPGESCNTAYSLYPAGILLHVFQVPLCWVILRIFSMVAGCTQHHNDLLLHNSTVTFSMPHTVIFMLVNLSTPRPHLFFYHCCWQTAK